MLDDELREISSYIMAELFKKNRDGFLSEKEFDRIAEELDSITERYYMHEISYEETLEQFEKVSGITR